MEIKWFNESGLKVEAQWKNTTSLSKQRWMNRVEGGVQDGETLA